MHQEISAFSTIMERLNGIADKNIQNIDKITIKTRGLIALWGNWQLFKYTISENHCYSLLRIVAIGRTEKCKSFQFQKPVMLNFLKGKAVLRTEIQEQMIMEPTALFLPPTFELQPLEVDTEAFLIVDSGSLIMSNLVDVSKMG